MMKEHEFAHVKHETSSQTFHNSDFELKQLNRKPSMAMTLN
jgi:hypothetical protein